MLRIQSDEHVSNDESLETRTTRTFILQIRKRKLTLLGHIMNKEHFGNVIQDSLKVSMRYATNNLPGKLE